VNGGGRIVAAALAALQTLQSFHGLSIGRGFEPRNEHYDPGAQRLDHRPSQQLP